MPQQFQPIAGCTAGPRGGPMSMMLGRAALCLALPHATSPAPTAHCPDPTPPQNGFRTPAPPEGDAGYTPGDELYFYCGPSFSLARSSLACAVCGPDGKWMPDLSAAAQPECVANSSAVPQLACGRKENPIQCPGRIPNRRNAKCNLATVWHDTGRAAALACALCSLASLISDLDRRSALPLPASSCCSTSAAPPLAPLAPCSAPRLTSGANTPAALGYVDVRAPSSRPATQSSCITLQLSHHVAFGLQGQASGTDVTARYEHAQLMMEIFPEGAPWLDQPKTRTDGLAFVGVSMTRNHAATQPMSNSKSVSRQTQFDFNKLIDRPYDYYGGTSDDGWLAGGGEDGSSYKLPNPDSAHIELMRVGNFNTSWGGLPIETIAEVLRNGTILIPQMGLTPSYLNARGFGADTMPPPEVELRFNLEPPSDLDTAAVDTWPNWQLMFVHNQLFEALQFPARFCPSPFHMTLTRNGQFRSADSMNQYLAQASAVIEQWRQRGPQLLQPEVDPTQPGYPSPVLGAELTDPHGIHLFRDRNTPLHYFAPNFLPPYNSSEKRKVIAEVLSKLWNDETKRFEPAPWADGSGGGGHKPGHGTASRCEAALEEHCGLARRSGAASGQQCRECCGEKQLLLHSAGCGSDDIATWCHG
eukprot:SAG22_NODE_1590_length_4048_cov_3.816156_1_plen_644_part_00